MALPAPLAALTVLSVAVLATGAGAVGRAGPASGPAAVVDPRPAAAVPLAPAPHASPSGARWRWPVEPPQVLRPFAPGPHRWSPGHRGVDLAAVPGAPVRAPAGGVVTWAGRLAGRPIVVLTHDVGPGGTPLRTTYEPVEPAVAVGAHLAAGETLGRIAAASGHCAAVSCLHWGAVAGRDDYVNPLQFLAKRDPPILLPDPAS